MLWAFASAAITAFPACRDDVAVRVKEGERFPVIDLPDLDGNRRQFASIPGLPMVVNFWASWCDPCRREMPSLERLNKLFSADELLVVGIAVDSDVNLAREFGLRLGLTFPLLSDSDQALSSGKLGIPAYPATYLVRSDRTVARIVDGERDWADRRMTGEIERLLAVHRLPAG